MPNLLTFRSRPNWLKGRTRILGASEAPGVLGVSEWGLTPLKVWLNKTQPKIDEDDSDKPWLEWGHRLEPVIAEAFSEKFERQVVTPGRYYGRRAPFVISIDQEHPWLGASVDRFQYKPGRAAKKQAGVLEIKTSAFDESFDDEPPLDYLVQGQHQLRATGLEWGDFAVLVRGSIFRTFHFERNDAFIRKMVRIEQAFWKMVTEGTPPPPSALDASALARLFPHEDPDSVIALKPETIRMPTGEEWTLDPHEAIRRKVALKALANKVEAEIEECEVVLKSMLGDASRGVLPDGSYASWATVKGYYRNKGLECPECHHTFDDGWVPDSRRFRVHIPKKLKADLPDILGLADVPPLLPETTEQHSIGEDDGDNETA